MDSEQFSDVSSKDAIFEAATTFENLVLASFPKKDKLGLKGMDRKLQRTVLVPLSHFHQNSESLLKLKLIESTPSSY